MKETPQQYTKRILKNQQGKDPVSVLSSTPAKIAKLLRGSLSEATHDASCAREMVSRGNSGSPGGC